MIYTHTHVNMDNRLTGVRMDIAAVFALRHGRAHAVIALWFVKSFHKSHRTLHREPSTKNR